MKSQEESDESEVSFIHVKYNLFIDFVFSFSRQRKPVRRNQKESFRRTFLKRDLRNQMRKRISMSL